MCEDRAHEAADLPRHVSGEENPFSERRLVENEKVMEALNDRLARRVEEIRSDADAGETGDDDEVAFFCECSDLACRGRIRMSPARFRRIHRDPALFIVLPGHETLQVESVVDTWGDHLIVRKYALD